MSVTPGRRLLLYDCACQKQTRCPEVAQQIAPESRVVYVDSDPIVLAHARALLTSTTGPTAMWGGVGYKG
jgi:hypothetical protein